MQCVPCPFPSRAVPPLAGRPPGPGGKEYCPDRQRGDDDDGDRQPHDDDRDRGGDDDTGARQQGGQPIARRRASLRAGEIQPDQEHRPGGRRHHAAQDRLDGRLAGNPDKKCGEQAGDRRTRAEQTGE